jgi:hypothetical protein
MIFQKKFKELLKSKYPCIFVETTDWEYIDNDIQDFSDSEEKCLYSWTPQKGLHKNNGKNHITATLHPNLTLQMIQFFSLSSNTPSLFVLKDFHQHLDDPHNERLFIELLDSMKDSSNKVILISQDYRIPIKIKPFVAHITTGIVSVKEIKRILVQQLKEVIRVNKKFKIQMIPQDQIKLIESLNGLSENKIKEFMDHAFEDGILNAEDIERILDFRKKTFDKQGF